MAKQMTPKRYGFHYINIILAVFFLSVFVLSAKTTNLNAGAFFDAKNLAGVVKFADGLWPPNTDPAFLKDTLALIWQTIAISVAGTTLAISFAVPLAIGATRARGEEFSRARTGTAAWLLRWSLYYASRFILNLCRGIPELLWALIFIVAVGLGPFPGVLALAAHSTGVLGKLYAEILESVDQNIVEAARSSGASEIGIMAFTKVPATLPVLLSYTLFRWECNMRAATVLGFVGAGGIGTQLTLSMQLFNYSEVATLVLVIIALVVMVDLVGQLIRTRLLDQSVACEKEV